MSNKKYSKKQNVSYKPKCKITKTWENKDGTFTAAIEVPMFLSNEKYTLLFVTMAWYIAQYMERENITSCEEWDNRDNDQQLHNKTIEYIFNAFGKICVLELNIDMVEYAQILVDCIHNLKHSDKNWFDDIITPRTNFKYDWMPIYEALTCAINSRIKEAAPILLDYYTKQKQTAK